MWERVILSWLAPLVRQLNINDRWSSFVFFEQWMGSLKNKSEQGSCKKKTILLISANRGRFIETVKMAILLAWRGHKVEYGYFPYCQAPFKEPLEEDPCVLDWLDWVFRRLQILAGDKINFISFAHYTSELTQEDHQEIDKQVRYDSIISLKLEVFNLSNDQHRRMFEHWQRKERDVCKAFRGYLENNPRPDIVNSGNGAWGISSQIDRLCREYNIEYNGYDYGVTKKTLCVCHNDDIRGFKDIELIWDKRKELGYLKSNNIERIKNLVDKLGAEKKAGASTNLLQYTNQKVEASGMEHVLKDLGIDPKTKYVLVLTSNPFDAGYDERALQTYKSTEDWLTDTIQTLVDGSNLQIIVRFHPRTSVNSRAIGNKLSHSAGDEHERFEKWVGECTGRKKRVTIVGPDSEVNTYSLMAGAEFGVTFSSITTVEMGILGKKVIPLLQLYYCGKGFTIDSDSKEEYLVNLKKASVQVEADKLQSSEEAILNAYLISFIFYYAWSQPFVYRRPYDLVKYPLHKVLSIDGASVRKRANMSMGADPSKLENEYEYLVDVLDSLSLNEKEFRQEIYRFMGADNVLRKYEARFN
jgi:hypothetical protein